MCKRPNPNIRPDADLGAQIPQFLPPARPLQHQLFPMGHGWGLGRRTKPASPGAQTCEGAAGRRGGRRREWRWGGLNSDKIPRFAVSLDGVVAHVGEVALIPHHIQGHPSFKKSHDPPSSSIQIPPPPDMLVPRVRRQGRRRRIPAHRRHSPTGTGAAISVLWPRRVSWGTSPSRVCQRGL